MEKHEDKHTQFAYRSIHDFFDQYHLHTAIQELEMIILTAGSSYAWKRGVPYDVMYFFKELKMLAKAAWFIDKTSYEEDGVALSERQQESAPDIEQQKHFVSGSPNVSPWQSFPRSLSEDEYFNPYLAIKVFCHTYTKQEWKKIWKHLIEYAFSAEAMDAEGEYSFSDILKIRTGIITLIEGCHLIEVRTHRKNK
jgi:hypothetical protein